MNSAQPTPIQHNYGSELLVFAIIFPAEELKVHPAYLRGRPIGEETKVESESSSDESSGEYSDGEKAVFNRHGYDLHTPIRADPRMLSAMMLLESTARKLWKKSQTGRVVIPKSGGRSSRSVILAHTSNPYDAEILPPETIEKLKEALNTTRDPGWYRPMDNLKPSQPAPIQHNCGSELLVFAFIFPADELKVHPAYLRGRPIGEETKVESESSSDESGGEYSDGEKAVPNRHAQDLHTPIRADPRMLSAMMLLESTARKLWKKSRTGRVVIPKSGGRSSRSVILAHTSNPYDAEIPPPETIEKLKQALNTTRDPAWYRPMDRLK